LEWIEITARLRLALTAVGSLALAVASGASPAWASAASTSASSGVPASPWSHARGFLGPIGWYWNTIYYRVFGGSLSDVIVFGGALFIAPVVLVVAMVAVLGGTKGARRRPIVPDEIRTQRH
jgi:hypothetical protein